MAITVKHKFVSAIPDAGDPTIVQPSNWNDDHQLTGTVPVTNGGTGASTANDGFNALAPSQTGNSGKFLTTDGTNSSWATNPLGTVTSVAATAGTGISVTGSPITTSGTLNITNTAPDQTVVLTAGTGISTSGTYPNFTITNTSPSSGGTVTSVASGTGLTGGPITTTGTLSIANTGVTAGTYGSAAVIPVIAVNSQGQITSISTQPTNAPAYQGTWNASTNTPILISSVGTAGYYYVVSVAGNTSLNGVTGWAVGDWAIFENGVWQKIAGSSSESFTNLTTTNLAVTGLTGYMYANNTTGNVTASTTIPNAGLANSAITINGTSTSLGGSINVGTVTSVTGTAPVVSSGGATPAISMAAANTTTNGYLTSTDWNTFNSKGTVTSVAATVPSFLSVTGSPITTSGTLAIAYSGTALPVANGGTGITSLTAGYIPYGNGTSGLSSTSALNYNATNTTLNAPVLSVNSTTNTTPNLSFNASNSGITSGATVANSYLQTIIQNKSGSAGASTNYVLSNDLGTDSSYYGEFGMNSSVYSSGTPADFFSINNGVYFSGHDGDISVGSGNGYKTYLTFGTLGQSSHVINASGAIGLSTNLGTTPALSGTTGYGTSGQVLTSQGNSSAPTWTTPTTGTVTSVTATSPITSTGGTTPVIAMPAATTTVSGYLTSTDWNTFNGKQATLVSGTNIKTVSGVSLLGSGDVGVIGATYGGTGVNNGSNTITLGGSLTYSGAYTQTWTRTANTSLTLPVSGTVLSSVTAPTNNPITGTPSSSNYLRGDGTWAAVSVSPAGSNTQVQYNNSGSFGASASYTFDGTTESAPVQNASNGFHLNPTTIATNYTIPTGYNAMTAGKVTVNTNVTVTVSTGSRWVVV